MILCVTYNPYLKRIVGLSLNLSVVVNNLSSLGDFSSLGPIEKLVVDSFRQLDFCDMPYSDTCWIERYDGDLLSITLIPFYLRALCCCTIMLS